MSEQESAKCDECGESEGHFVHDPECPIEILESAGMKHHEFVEPELSRARKGAWAEAIDKKIETLEKHTFDIYRVKVKVTR